MSTPLDQKFWDRFARTFWEQKAFTAQKIESDLTQIDGEAVFDLLVEVAKRARKEKSPLGFKFYVYGLRSSKVETMFVLPRQSDKSLLGYHERMERVYQDYCLVCDELFEIKKERDNPLHTFVRNLYRHVGKKKLAEVGLYLGNYKKTPFGVHVDACGVFSFPVVGKKKFRTWAASYGNRHSDLEQSFRYSKHKSKSKLLIAKPGDMTYWPSTEWHIAESDGNFSVTWSLAIWLKTPPKYSPKAKT